MRRVLADSTFLRVYLLLALALLLTFGLGLLGVALVDQVRREAHREQLAEAPMRLLAERLSALPPAAHGGWLDAQGQRLDMRASVGPLEEAELGYFSRLRLARGKVLVQPQDDQGWRLLSLLPGSERLLRVELTNLSEHQLRGLTELLGEWLTAVSPPPARPGSERLAGGSLPVSLEEAPPGGLDDYQLRRLTDGEVVIQLLPGRWSVAIYLALQERSGDASWLMIGPVQAFEPMPDRCSCCWC